MDVPNPRPGRLPSFAYALLSINGSKIACIIGIITYWWMVDFPERAQLSFHFLGKDEAERAVARIQTDRGDVKPTAFSWSEVLKHVLDLKLYGFAAMFFLLVCSIVPLMTAIDLSNSELSFDRLILLFTNHVWLVLVDFRFILNSVAVFKAEWGSAPIKQSCYLHLYALVGVF